MYSILQDKKGYMWFGTPDGLCRYDGSELKVFKYKSTVAGDVINNFVKGKMLEDDAGNIWYCNGSGIYKWNVIKENVEKIRVFNKSDFKSVEFKSLDLDSSGRLWLFNLVDGIFEFNIHSGKLKQYSLPLPTNASTVLFSYTTEDNAGNFWLRVVSNNEGYFVFNKFSHNYSSQFAVNPPHAIFFSHNKMIQAFDDRLIYKDLPAGGVRIVPKLIDDKKVKFFSFDGIRDNYGRLWMTSRGNGGLFYYDENHDRFREFHHDNSKIKSLPFDLTTCLYIDRSDNLWIGMDGGGVAKLDLKQPKFNLFPLSEGDYPVLNDYFTKCFYEDDKRRIWFGSHTNGLNILTPETGALINYHNEKNNPNSLPGNIVGSILKDRERNMWIGSSGGISLFNEKKKVFKTIVLNDIPKLKPDRNIFIYKIIQLKNGDLLAATLNGLIKITKQKKTGYAGFYLTDNPFIKSAATDVLERRDGTIYTTLPGSGLYELKNDGEKYNITNMFLSGLDLRSVRADENNPEYLWVSTGKGLIYFNSTTKEFKILDEKNGLANSYVYGSLEDEKHNLWICTNGGLSYFDRSNNHIDNYSYQDGLQSNEFNTQAFFKSATNTFYFGGIKGFNWFQSKKITRNQYKPQVAITQIAVNNIPLAIDSVLLTHDNIKLSYDKNDLNFKFAALDYTRPEANKIQYKLDGWDTKWITTNDRSVRYSKLPPGNYTMILKGSNASGIWSDEQKIVIIIQSPFWKTMWFLITLAVLLLSAIVFITYKISQQKVKRRLQLLEKQIAVDAERNRISTDMHDEIGSGITHIALMSELMQTQNKDEKELKKDINIIGISARRLVQTMSEIIWALSPQNDTMENLLAYTREQTQQYFESLNVKFNVDFPDDVPDIKLSNAERRNLYLVTREALNNAMKHAGADAIKVKMEITKTVYCFRVIDNGIGMNDKSIKHGNNGMRNMKKRMEDIGGTIKWLPLETGTAVEYCLPI